MTLVQWTVSGFFLLDQLTNELNRAMVCIQLIFRAGLRNLYWLMYGKRFRLRILLSNTNAKMCKTNYDNFRIDSRQRGYKLRSLGRFSGNAG